MFRLWIIGFERRKTKKKNTHTHAYSGFVSLVHCHTFIVLCGFVSNVIHFFVNSLFCFHFVSILFPLFIGLVATYIRAIPAIANTQNCALIKGMITFNSKTTLFNADREKYYKILKSIKLFEEIRTSFDFRSSCNSL